MEKYLKPTEFLDFDDETVRRFTGESIVGAVTDRERAVALYYAVRDGFQYDPYILDLRKEGLRASKLLTKKRGYCVEKAVLLAASARAAGIPSRLSFYIVRNHIATGRLEKVLQKDYLVFHGAAEMYLEGKWLKTTPAFDKRLCDFLGVEPLEFDGSADSIFQEFDRSGNSFMEYVQEYGNFHDLPYEQYLNELRAHYPHIFENDKYMKEDLVYDFRR